MIENRLKRYETQILTLARVVEKKYDRILGVIRELGTRRDGHWEYTEIKPLLFIFHRKEDGIQEYPHLYLRIGEDGKLRIYVNINGWIVSRYVCAEDHLVITDHEPELLMEDISIMGKEFLKNRGLVLAIIIGVLKKLEYWSLTKEQRKKLRKR